MTIDEQFDNEILYRNGRKNGRYNSMSTFDERLIKQFYNDKIKEMVKEMIGEEKYNSIGNNLVMDIRRGYNKKRQEIINTALKYGVDIKE
jgi:hypothetical protein